MWLLIGISTFLIVIADLILRAKGNSSQMKQKEHAQKSFGKYWQIWYVVLYTIMPLVLATFILVVSIVWTVS